MAPPPYLQQATACRGGEGGAQAQEQQLTDQQLARLRDNRKRALARRQARRRAASCGLDDSEGGPQWEEPEEARAEPAADPELDPRPAQPSAAQQKLAAMLARIRAKQAEAKP